MQFISAPSERTRSLLPGGPRWPPLAAFRHEFNDVGVLFLSPVCLFLVVLGLPRCVWLSLRSTGSAAPRRVGSSLPRDGTHGPCTASRLPTLDHSGSPALFLKRCAVHWFYIFTRLSDHNHCLNPDIFITPAREILYTSVVTSHSHPPIHLETTNLLFASVYLPIMDILYKWDHIIRDFL